MLGVLFGLPLMIILLIAELRKDGSEYEKTNPDTVKLYVFWIVVFGLAWIMIFREYGG